MARKKPLHHDRQMSLGEHLEELRTRLIRALLGMAVAMAVTLAFGRPIIRLMAHPYSKAMTEAGLTPDLNVPTLTGGFNTYMKVGVIGGLVLGAPWIFYQIWMFIAVGLYPKERRCVTYAVPFCAALFIAGAMFFLFVAAIPAMKFLVSFNRWMGLKPVIMLGTYVSFVTDMMLAAGIVFQMPMAILILAWAGLVSMKTLNRYRRHVIVGIMILAAVLTPPDPASQILLGLPMYLLYEVGVVLAYVLVLRKRPAGEDQ